MTKHKILYIAQHICDLHLEISLTYCGKLMVEAGWFGVMGENSVTLHTNPTKEFNQYTKWDDFLAVELYNSMSKE